MNANDEQALDQAMERFAGLIKRIDARQSRIEARVALLYQLLFGAVIVLVASLSFLTIILSRQIPDATAAVTGLNEHFAQVADHMDAMERSVRVIDQGVSELPEVIRHVDQMHGGVAFMSQDVTEIAGAIGTIDASMGTMTTSLADMRQSFQVMEQTVQRMGQDVNHLSQPMRMFNWMNPFR
ncbi:hypothetical protein [Halochromatium glycolicum]|uniref:Translation initiation factor 2 n=1 Tax=Halochromatium glycolicum TaxID=85075 RepID=A0AAJ0U4K6_9GAMM|nr:hypothetical protein [Halochromatium glycolicum]MBK1705164.1 hypothetical protein [Halochromatium glycolicum]